MTPSDWIEENLVFPDGNLQGQKVKFYEFQKAPVNDIVNPKIRKIVLMSSAQLLKTTVLQNAMYYFLANDPTNMMFGGATAATTSRFRTGKWQSVIETCPVLKELVTNKNDKNYTNNDKTQQNKDGTFTYFVSLGAASALRGPTIPRIFLDEISNVEADGEEGNPLVLAEQRTKAISNPLIMVCSTPLNETDLITQQYEQSNKQKFYVPCPHCNHEHELVFENIKFSWKSIEGGRRSIPDAETAHLQCPKCEATITDAQRIRAVKKGHWVVTNPEVTDVSGYHISRLYSPVSSIKSIIIDFAQAHYTFDLPSFYNNVLGLPWVDEDNKEQDLVLLENLRDENIDIDNIPDEDTLGIVMGIDQQESRLEVTTIAVGQKNIYVLDHRSIHGIDTTKIECSVWRELRAFSNRQFKTKTGRPLKLIVAAVDSGFGAGTNTVYKFTNTAPLFQSIKGSSNLMAPIFKESTVKGQTLININPNIGKTKVRQLLNRALNDRDNTKETQIHFSYSLPDDYMMQVTSEQCTINKGVRVWTKKHSNVRNEALDCLSYSIVLFEWKLNSLGKEPFRQLREFNEKLNTEKVTKEPKKRNRGLDVLRGK
ncbi:phage terminase large subunit family protein [Pluralibacter gergoviae]|nr:phage terminase large subunit family protein [Pluralibacter gergoviae]